VVHVDGSDLAAALRCARIAQQQGGLVSIDLDLGSGQLPAGSDELIALADLCVVPSGLPEALTGHPDTATAALALGQRTAGLVVVTLGSAGCLAVSDGQILTQPALQPPGRIVDTTACGDTFRAALLSQVLAAAAGPDPDPATDQRLTAALRYACAAAALKCQQAGRKGCPTGDAVDAFLNQPGAGQ
jgi:sugar/nucleoside kinase (ribokinase family)